MKKRALAVMPQRAFFIAVLFMALLSLTARHFPRHRFCDA